MDQEATRVTPSPPEPDAPPARDEDLRRLIDTLVAFLDELQHLKFNIGVQQYVEAQNLLISLAARGHLPQDISALRTLLSPLLCCTPEEQENFYRHFDLWFVERIRQTAPFGEIREATHSESNLPAATHERVFLPHTSTWLIVAVAAMAALLTYGFWPDGEGQGLKFPSLPAPGDRFVLLTFFAVMILLLLSFAYAGWRRLRRRHNIRLQLESWRSVKRVELDKLIVRRPLAQLYRGLTFRRTIQQMRRPRRSSDRFLDVTQTVEATIRRGGWFTPVYNTQQASPEYLVLIDRASYRDQQARLADEIVNRLRENNVFVESYYFQGDPRECRKAEPKAPHLTLQDLAALYPDHYLLIFSDGAGLFNSLTGRPQPWLNMISHWHGRAALLTPEASTHWGYREWALSASEVMVLQATTDGLTMLINFIDTGSLPEASRSYWRRPFPQMLRERSGRWLEAHKPEPLAVSKLCSQLRRFLGDEGYLWLIACAIYPLLQWELTLYFGYELTGRSNIEERLMALVRLPWFRHGMMPDWLRLRLISDLTELQESTVRRKLEELLISSLEQPQFNFPLKFARSVDGLKGGALHRLRLSLVNAVQERKRRRLLRSVIETEAAGSPLRDYVFLSFVSGGNPGRLAVTIPHQLMGFFLPSYREATPSTVLLNLSKRALASLTAVVYRKREEVGVIKDTDIGSQPSTDSGVGAVHPKTTFSLSSFLSNDLALDLGTANTLIYAKGRGIVIAENTLAAVNNVTDKVDAVGKEAEELIRHSPDKVSALRPMKDGAIANFEVAERILQHFIRKASRGKTWMRPRIVIGIPGEITQVERHALMDVAYRANASEVYLVEKTICAAIGAGLDITEPHGNMIVDIGSGTTEVAVISLSGIVYSRAVRAAGNEMDEAITQHVMRRYKILISERTAEAIKIQLGSAYPLDEPLSMDVRGRHITEGLFKTITITDEEIREALADAVAVIINLVRVALERTSPELSTDIVERGIVLTGGGALLKNLDKRLSIETELSVSIADDPLSCVVLGAGKLLSDSDLLKRVRWDLTF